MPRIPPELTARQRPEVENNPLRILSQETNISKLEMLGVGEWTTLYEFQENEDGTNCLYSVLMTKEQAEMALKNSFWDLMIGQGGPGFSQTYIDGETLTTYDRFGFTGIEPIVYVRNFHNLKPKQFDISEEFRLFHNLYHDRRNDIYIFIEDNGSDTVVIEVTPARVRVKTLFLRRYISARQLYLAFFFDCRANVFVNLAEAKAALPDKEITTVDHRYAFHVGEIFDKTFSRLIGKYLLPPFPIEESGVWPFNDGLYQYEDFMIGTDHTGNPIWHSCNHDTLANSFGKNENSPHYLTPVWFRRDVLAKYYNEPEKYTVEDGYLRCGSLWGIRLDNDLSNYVMVYLGDLGRDLSYEEQKHWRHHNILPPNNRSSETNYKRAFLAEFVDPSSPDLVFRRKYIEIQEAWKSRYEWSLFRPAHEDDAHILKQIRVPVTNSMTEFEMQVLYLAKLIVDSLNDAGIVKACGSKLEGEKSLAKLERYLRLKQYHYTDRDIEFLKLLQSLRSTGSAHTKGEDFKKLKARLGLNHRSSQDVFAELLERANTMLDDMGTHFISPKE